MAFSVNENWKKEKLAMRLRKVSVSFAEVFLKKKNDHEMFLSYRIHSGMILISLPLSHLLLSD